MTMASPTRSIPVWVIVPPRALLLDIAGPIEVLRRAGIEQRGVRFDLRYAGPARAVTSSIGLTLSGIEPLPDAIADDRPDEDVARDEAAIVSWLSGFVRPSHTLISICSGALLAARAGLLDGHECTTHFTCCTALAKIAPRARVLENRLYVVDGRRCSSAGVTAGTDLMLHLVSQILSPAIALSVARQLVIYLRRSGADPQLSPWLEGRNHIHPAVHRAQDAIASDPSRSWSLAALARIANTSPRHLSRLFNEYASMSVPDYINRLRVSLARELLGQTRLDMERIAERSGFASARQLRRAWRRSYATSPHEARATAR